jgi:hypothetical protein
MTTPNETGMTQPLEAADAPVWQPDLAPAATPDRDETAAGAANTSDEVPLVRGPVRARRAGSTTALLAIAAMVALGGIGFAVGRATAPDRSGTVTTNAATANGVPVQGAAPSGAAALGAIPSGLAGGLDDRGGPGVDGRLDDGAPTITGTVVSVSSSSMTIKLATGQTVTVATGSSTVYHAQTTAASTDVTAGASVVVQTSAATSTTAGAAGSRTATNVIITAR